MEQKKMPRESLCTSLKKKHADKPKLFTEEHFKAE